MRYLVRHGADIDILSLAGQTPLMFAISGGNVSMVKLLLSEGKVPIKSSKMKRGLPLLAALDLDEPFIAELLVERVCVG